VSPYQGERGRWLQLREQLDAVRTAISLIHEPLRKSWLDGSASYCDALAPEYRRIAGSVAAAAIELGVAMMAHERFADDLRSQGVARARLGPLPLSDLGMPTKNSPFSRLLKAAVEYGYVHIDDVPTDWVG